VRPLRVQPRKSETNELGIRVPTSRHNIRSPNQSGTGPTVLHSSCLFGAGKAAEI
jgi:hypothetical protein